MASNVTMGLTGAESVADNPSGALPVGWTLDRVICWCLVCAVVFINGADFRGDTGENFSVHWQIYLRLLIAAVCGVVGLLLLFPRSYRDFLTWPGLLFTFQCAWYGVTLPMSVHQSYSTAAWASLIGVTVLIPGAMRLLGGYRLVLAIATGLILFLVGSWIAFLFFPDVGVFQEQVTQTYVYQRMGGLAHPNELGFYSAYTVLIFTALGVSGRFRWSIAGLGILLGAITLAVCFSRAASIACCAGLVIMLSRHLRLRGNASALLGVSALLIAAAFFALGFGKFDWMVSDMITKVTKSGSAEELLTITGRTEIWAYGMERIQESPITGYGYCSARFVMEDFSYHCHNIVLNAALFSGLPGGLLLLAIIGYHLACVFFRPYYLTDGLFICMLVGGSVDGLFPSPSPAASTLIWIVLLFWRQLAMRLEEPNSDSQGLVAAPSAVRAS